MKEDMVYGAPSMVYEPAYTGLHIPAAAWPPYVMYKIDIHRVCGVLPQGTEPLCTEAERLPLPVYAELYIYC
jgi:hypothetical protein